MKQRGTSAAQSVESRKDSHAVRPVKRFDGTVLSERLDSIIQEVSIDVVVDGKAAYTTTCSPWNIEELVVGRLYLEGTIRDRTSLGRVSVNYLQGQVDISLQLSKVSAQEKCVIVPFDDLVAWVRGVSACRFDLDVAPFCISPQTINASIAMLEKQSLLFRKTGGVHSAVLADDQGEVLVWYEDIGRHSAMDKLVGWCVLNNIDASKYMILFSGRVPQEIIAKVARLGCPLIASPGAPTSLSIETAESCGVTLIGFAKQGQFNVYTHTARVDMVKH